MIELKLRGQTKQLDSIPDMCVIPFARALGTEIAPGEDEPGYEAWRERFIMRFAEPLNMAPVAYGIKALWPELPDEWVSYDLFQQQDGQVKVKFRLALTAEEFLTLIQPISKALEARPTAKAKRVTREVAVPV